MTEPPKSPKEAKADKKKGGNNKAKDNSTTNGATGSGSADAAATTETTNGTPPATEGSQAKEPVFKHPILILMACFMIVQSGFIHTTLTTLGVLEKPITASASHILVKDKVFCEKLKADLGADLGEGLSKFIEVAKEYSTCPSGKRTGGALGSFQPGKMVAEFDKVVFDPKTELNTVYGPIETQFGFHLLVVTEREDLPERIMKAHEEAAKGSNSTATDDTGSTESDASKSDSESDSSKESEKGEL